MGPEPTPTTVGTPARPSTRPSPPASGSGRVVTHITDGDTIRLGAERIRLIGIDAPEVTQHECYSARSTAALAGLIPVGSRVRLVLDVDPHDRYERTLAYVYRVSDGLHVNARMVRDGHVTTLTISPNVAHANEFASLQRAARNAKRGLWGACETQPASSRPAAAAAPVAPQPFAGNCDPSYPDVCIPRAPPDLNCPDVSHRDFRVVGSDPHGFDRDRDGIGCES